MSASDFTAVSNMQRHLSPRCYKQLSDRMGPCSRRLSPAQTRVMGSVEVGSAVTRSDTSSPSFRAHRAHLLSPPVAGADQRDGQREGRQRLDQVRHTEVLRPLHQAAHAEAVVPAQPGDGTMIPHVVLQPHTASNQLCMWNHIWQAGLLRLPTDPCIDQTTARASEQVGPQTSLKSMTCCSISGVRQVN